MVATALTAVGVAISGFGAASSYIEGKKQAKKAQAFQAQAEQEQAQYNEAIGQINNLVRSQNPLYETINAETQARDRLASEKETKLIAIRRQAERLAFQEQMAESRRQARLNIREAIIAGADTVAAAGEGGLLDSSAYEGARASNITQAQTIGNRIIQERTRARTLNRLGNESYNVSNYYNRLIGRREEAIANAATGIQRIERDIAVRRGEAGQFQANIQGISSSAQAAQTQSQTKQQGYNSLFSTGASLVQNAGLFDKVLKTTFQGSR